MCSSDLVGCVSGKCGGTGIVRSERVLAHSVQSPFFTGPLRSPLRLQNTFAHESFMDEICSALKVDPLEFRLRHLGQNRVSDALKAAAKAADWKPRPFPAGRADAPARGRGIACIAYEGDNGYAALIAEVEVDPATGQVHPKRFVVGHDCGPVSNPEEIGRASCRERV